MSTILLFALAAAFSIPAASQQAPPPATASDFITKAAQAGAWEVEVGKLASVKASNPDVKAFGRRLIVDYYVSNEELLQLSKRKGVAVSVTLKSDPTEPLKPAASTTNLATLEGAAFDRAFIEQMVKAHQEAVDLFHAEADEGTDAEIKDWAEKKLAGLKEHLRLSKELQEKLTR